MVNSTSAKKGDPWVGRVYDAGGKLFVVKSEPDRKLQCTATLIIGAKVFDGATIDTTCIGEVTIRLV